MPFRDPTSLPKGWCQNHKLWSAIASRMLVGLPGASLFLVWAACQAVGQFIQNKRCKRKFTESDADGGIRPSYSTMMRMADNWQDKLFVNTFGALLIVCLMHFLGGLQFINVLWTPINTTSLRHFHNDCWCFADDAFSHTTLNCVTREQQAKVTRVCRLGSNLCCVVYQVGILAS